jgi:hypothetical protein
MFSIRCFDEKKSPWGKLPKGAWKLTLATWQSWPYGCRPMVLRRRLSVTLPFHRLCASMLPYVALSVKEIVRIEAGKPCR